MFYWILLIYLDNIKSDLIYFHQSNYIIDNLFNF